MDPNLVGTERRINNDRIRAVMVKERRLERLWLKRRSGLMETNEVQKRRNGETKEKKEMRMKEKRMKEKRMEKQKMEKMQEKWRQREKK